MINGQNLDPPKFLHFFEQMSTYKRSLRIELPPFDSFLMFSALLFQSINICFSSKPYINFTAKLPRILCKLLTSIVSRFLVYKTEVPTSPNTGNSLIPGTKLFFVLTTLSNVTSHFPLTNQ
jgi:hypothetical protein